MKEQLISFETAKLAKEKNYPFYFTAIGDTKEVPLNIPTQSLLQKWLREEHHEHINITFMVAINNYHVSLTMRSMGWGGFKTYEQALERGLQEALKLI